jgi:outer membrane protein assembly factor BamA
MASKLAAACACVACCLGTSDLFAQTPPQQQQQQTETCALPNPAPACWIETRSPTPSTPSTPSKPKKARARGHAAKAQRWMSRFGGTSDGWTPRVGTITSGSGAAAGATYQRPILGGAMRMTTDAMVSIRGYHAIEAGAFATPFKNPRILVGARVRHEGYPQEHFYGIGQDSRRDDRTSYWRQGYDTNAFVTIAPRSWLSVEGTAGYLDMQIRAGRDSAVPTIHERFTDATAPGLSQDGRLLHAGVAVRIDRSDDVFFPRTGGRYDAGVTAFHAVDRVSNDFRRVDLDVRRYVAVPRTRSHVIALRGSSVMTGTSGDGAIPFYMLPRLGGSRTLRGYESSRLTDRHALAFSVEHRWLVVPALQIVSFVDAGQVASRLDAFGLADFSTSFGAGVRYRFGDTAVVRLDLATGHEGHRVIVGVGPGF